MQMPFSSGQSWCFRGENLAAGLRWVTCSTSGSRVEIVTVVKGLIKGLILAKAVFSSYILGKSILGDVTKNSLRKSGKVLQCIFFLRFSILKALEVPE